MDKTRLQELLQETIPVVKAAGAFIRQELGRVSEDAVEEKSLNSLVSYVDTTAEKRLVKALQELLPGSTFLTEEGTVTAQKSNYQWIIDPLDGTTNFLHQIPVFSVSVALQEGGQTILGIVYEINRDECFYAIKGQGAFLNGRPIRVTANIFLKDTLLATGFPYYNYDRIEGYLQVLKTLMAHSRGIRRLGSAAVDLAYVAAGRFDAFYEYSLNAWDVAAGAFIVQEAGGEVMDFSGGANYLYGQELIAGTPAIAQEVLQLIRQFFSSEPE
jgi:myo-inositol-1(or 4)-monophosphatase